MYALALAIALQSTPSYTGIRNLEEWGPTGLDANFLQVEAGQVTDDEHPDVVLLDGSQLALLSGTAAYHDPILFGQAATAFATTPNTTIFGRRRVVAAEGTGLVLYDWAGSGFGAGIPAAGSAALGSAASLRTWTKDSAFVAGLASDGQTFHTGTFTGNTFTVQTTFVTAAVLDWTPLDWDGVTGPELAVVHGSGLTIYTASGTTLLGPLPVPATTPRVARIPDTGEGFDRLLWIVDDLLSPYEYALILDQRYPAAFEPGFALGANAGSVTVTDMDSDGHGDLVISGATSPSARVYRRDPTVAFPQLSFVPPASSTGQIDLHHGPGFAAPLIVGADFDRDGDTDLVLASPTYEHVEFLRGDVTDELSLVPDIPNVVHGLDGVISLNLDLQMSTNPALEPLPGNSGTLTATHYELTVYEKPANGDPVVATPTVAVVEPFQTGTLTVNLQWAKVEPQGSVLWPITIRLVRRLDGSTTHAGPHLIYYYTNDQLLTLALENETNPWGSPSINVNTVTIDGAFENDPGAGLHQRPNVQPYNP